MTGLPRGRFDIWRNHPEIPDTSGINLYEEEAG